MPTPPPTSPPNPQAPPAKGKGGRKPLLTPECLEALVRAKKAGLPDKAACAVAGVGYSTFYRWMQEGETAKRGPKRELWERLTRARAEGQQALVSMVLGAAQGGVVLDKNGEPVKDRKGRPIRTPGDWKAAAWLLSVTDPEHFGKQVEVKHKGEVGGRVRLEVGSLRGLSEAELRALAVAGGDDEDGEEGGDE